MANRGEEKVRVHMNVVPRSTMNTNGETVQVQVSYVRDACLLLKDGVLK